MKFKLLRREKLEASYVIMRDLRLLMSGLGGWVMGRMGLGPSDSGVDRGPSTCSSASEEPPSRPWLWGSCSMVSCSSRLVSWISKSIWRRGIDMGSERRDSTLKPNIKLQAVCSSLKPHCVASTSSKGTLWMGVPLISRIRSPTWMEFFTSGLMQSVSTLNEVGKKNIKNSSNTVLQTLKCPVWTQTWDLIEPHLIWMTETSSAHFLLLHYTFKKTHLSHHPPYSL